MAKPDPAVKPYFNNVVDEENWTGRKFGFLMPIWILESRVQCRHLFGVDRAAVMDTFGPGDKDRFIRTLKSYAKGMAPGMRILIQWGLSSVGDHCVDVVFLAEKDPASVSHVVYE